MKTNQFVYHIVPRNLSGNILYPLNQLRELMPDVANVHLQKYAGREKLLERTIPILDCLWNDVLMFSPIHPTQLKAALNEEGYYPTPRKWFKIPAARLEPEKSAIYFSSLRAFGDYSHTAAEYKPFSLELLEKHHHLPDATRQHYRIAKSEGRVPFIFEGSPHILYKGRLDLEGIGVLTI